MKTLTKTLNFEPPRVLTTYIPGTQKTQTAYKFDLGKTKNNAIKSPICVVLTTCDIFQVIIFTCNHFYCSLLTYLIMYWQLPRTQQQKSKHLPEERPWE